MINTNKIQKKLFYLLGLICTFVALKFGPGQGIALFNYVILLIIIIQFINKGRIYIYFYKIPIYLFILLMSISIILNLNNINNSVLSDGIGITIKFLCFILPIIILFTDSELCIYRIKFFQGLYLGSWIQLIWGTMQIVLYHINGFLLNQVVFGNLLHINLEYADWTRYTGIGIRPTGIGWETAVYASSLLFGLIYTRKLYCKILFCIGILSSTSGTGIISLVALLIYEVTVNKYFIIKDKSRQLNCKKKYSVYSIVRALLITVSVCGIMLIFFMYNKNIISYSYVSLNRFIRMIEGGNMGETSTSIHMLYYKKLPSIIFHGNFIQGILGYGNFMVGRIYTLLYGLYSNTIAWNPESDFITILLGNGILGAILYYYLIYKAFILCKNRTLKKYLVIIFISGFSYLFIRGTYTFLIILFLMVKSPKNFKNKSLIEK